IGDANTGPLEEKVQRRSPVVAFSAKIIPSSVPPKTKLPAVAITPPHGGVSTLCSHLISPVPGSIAITLPQLSSGAPVARVIAPPVAGSYAPALAWAIVVGPATVLAVGSVLGCGTAFFENVLCSSRAKT